MSVFGENRAGERVSKTARCEHVEVRRYAKCKVRPSQGVACDHVEGVKCKGRGGQGVVGRHKIVLTDQKSKLRESCERSCFDDRMTRSRRVGEMCEWRQSACHATMQINGVCACS